MRIQIGENGAEQGCESVNISFKDGSELYCNGTEEDFVFINPDAIKAIRIKFKQYK